MRLAFAGELGFEFLYPRGTQIQYKNRLLAIWIRSADNFTRNFSVKSFKPQALN
jgi:hypothetical protein